MSHQHTVVTVENVNTVALAPRVIESASAAARDALPHWVTPDDAEESARRAVIGGLMAFAADPTRRLFFQVGRPDAPMRSLLTWVPLRIDLPRELPVDEAVGRADGVLPVGQFTDAIAATIEHHDDPRAAAAAIVAFLPHQDPGEEFDVAAVRARYEAALDAKPGKGDYTERGIDALTDAVCDIPRLLAWIEQQQSDLVAVTEALEKATTTLYELAE